MLWSITGAEMPYALGNPHPGCLPSDKECEHKMFIDIHLLSSKDSGKRGHILWLPFSHSYRQDTFEDVSPGSNFIFLVFQKTRFICFNTHLLTLEPSTVVLHFF